MIKLKHKKPSIFRCFECKGPIHKVVDRDDKEIGYSIGSDYVFKCSSCSLLFNIDKEELPPKPIMIWDRSGVIYV